MDKVTVLVAAFYAAPYLNIKSKQGKHFSHGIPSDKKRNSFLT